MNATRNIANATASVAPGATWTRPAKTLETACLIKTTLGEADSEPDRCQDKSLSDDELDNIRPPSAKGHANTEFVGSSGDRESDDAIDANRSEQHRETSKKRQ